MICYMKLVITIDTEEDNWADFISTGYTLENIEKIPELQALFDEFSVTPTYLITYPVATDEKSISTFKTILNEDKCEIGQHCHPWNTPPLVEEINERNSMLSNLSLELQFRKLQLLHNVIIENFGIEPISFRTGRWGYSSDVAKNLCKLGYRVDTSISAYTNWTKYYGPDFSAMSPEPFRFSSDQIFKKLSDGEMLQIPATVGYLQKNFTICNMLTHFFKRAYLKKIRLLGILDKLNLINKVWLSPELSDSKQMISLTQRMIKNGYEIINLMFHSTTLKAGLTPFVKTREEEKRFLKNIKEFLAFARYSGIESIKLKDTLKLT